MHFNRQVVLLSSFYSVLLSLLYFSLFNQVHEWSRWRRVGDGVTALEHNGVSFVGSKVKKKQLLAGGVAVTGACCSCHRRADWHSIDEPRLRRAQGVGGARQRAPQGWGRPCHRLRPPQEGAAHWEEHSPRIPHALPRTQLHHPRPSSICSTASASTVQGQLPRHSDGTSSASHAAGASTISCSVNQR
jgi:hypothetical protein